MSKWLNVRMRGEPAVKQELFPTEDRAIKALDEALELHRQKGRIVTEKWDGPKLRYEVEDQDGFVAVHWLSDTSEVSPYAESS